MRYLAGVFWNSGEHRTRAFWRIITFIIIWIVGFSLLSGVVQTAFAPSLLRGIVVTSVRLAWSLGILLVASRWFDRRPRGDTGFVLGDRERRWPWTDFVAGLGLVTVLFTALLTIEIMLGATQLAGLFQSPDGAFLPAILVELWVAIAVGITEEIVFRGYILRNAAEGLRGRWLNTGTTITLGLIFSSIVFSVFHAGNSDMSQLIYHVLSGIFFGLAYLLTGSLALPIGLHIANNFFILNVFSSQTDATSIFVFRTLRETWMDGAWGSYIVRSISILLVLGYVRWRYGAIRIHPSFTKSFTSVPKTDHQQRIAQQSSPFAAD